MADWNPLSGKFWDPGQIGSHLKDLWGSHLIPGSALDPSTFPKQGDGGQGPSQSDQNLNFINQYLNTVANSNGQSVTMTPQQILSFLNARTNTDWSKASKSDLLKELDKMKTNMGWQDAPGGVGTGTSSQSPYTPMAYQQFIQSSILPYLQQTQRWAEQDLKNLDSSLVPGLRPEYAAIIKQGNQDTKGNLEALDLATRNQIAWEMDPRNNLMLAQAQATAKANQAAANYKAALGTIQGQSQQVPY